MASAPRDNNRVPSLLLKDSIASTAIPLNGLTVGGLEAAMVAIVDASGNQITSFGGGTQYTDGGIAPSYPSAPTLEWNSGGTWVTVGNANPLPVTTTNSSTQYTVGTSVGANSIGNPVLNQNIGTNLWQIAGNVSSPYYTQLSDGTNIITLFKGGEGSTSEYGIKMLGDGSGNAYSPYIDASGNQHNFIWDAAGNGRGANVNAANQLSVSIDNIPTAIYNGITTVTTAGTRVTLSSSTSIKSVTIKALVGNTGHIYVGNSSVSSSNGFTLEPGDTVSMDISNLNTVNIDSSVNGEGISYIAVN